MEQMYEYVDEMLMGWFWAYADERIEQWAEDNNKEFDGMCREKVGEIIESIQLQANDDAKRFADEMCVEITRKIGGSNGLFGA